MLFGCLFVVVYLCHQTGLNMSHVTHRPLSCYILVWRWIINQTISKAFYSCSDYMILSLYVDPSFILSLSFGRSRICDNKAHGFS